jgi:hypothetical protein
MRPNRGKRNRAAPQKMKPSEKDRTAASVAPGQRTGPADGLLIRMIFLAPEIPGAPGVARPKQGPAPNPDLLLGFWPGAGVCKSGHLPAQRVAGLHLGCRPALKCRCPQTRAMAPAPQAAGRNVRRNARRSANPVRWLSEFEKYSGCGSGLCSELQPARPPRPRLLRQLKNNNMRDLPWFPVSRTLPPPRGRTQPGTRAGRRGAPSAMAPTGRPRPGSGPRHVA